MPRGQRGCGTLSTRLFLIRTASTEERKGRAQPKPQDKLSPQGALGHVDSHTFTSGDMGPNKSTRLSIECPMLWPWLNH